MDYGYPHPDDVTPAVQAMLDADAAMDAKRAGTKTVKSGAVGTPPTL